MRILVLHTAITDEARPDDQETLTTARVIAQTLTDNGHYATLAPFEPSLDAIRTRVKEARADVVFNLVENVMGQDVLAAIAPSMLEHLRIPYTGSSAAAIAATSDKPFAKSLLRASGFSTPDWAEPPSWQGLSDGRRYVVKAATEDASLALDDDAVCATSVAVRARANACAARYGGRWFAEAFVEGREFNVALVEEGGDWRALPVPEMRFEDWPRNKPTIVGYRAKWDEGSEESARTVRRFGLDAGEPALAAALVAAATGVCRLFGMRGYARVDFRVAPDGRPQILEANANPCLAPDAGFAAAAAELGWTYVQMIFRVLESAKSG